MGWAFLTGAIVTEVSGTLALRAAVNETKKWYFLVGVGYLLSFTMLSFALVQGIPLGAAYGFWSAAGISITAVLSKFFFKEPLTLLMGIGIALVVGGVLLIETGSTH